jgi:virulence-associated protein VagC
MTVAVLLGRLSAAGVRVRADGHRLIASPRERLTDELRALIQENKAEITAALTADSELPHDPESFGGSECMRCANLTMRVEHHEGTRRVFWWRCAKGYTLLEARSFGERVVLAPSECNAARAFEPWRTGQQ